MTEELFTGIDVIDLQHKEYFRRANRLNEISAEGKPPEKPLLDELINYIWLYTIEHFSTEEDIMADTGYPLISEHKAKHDFFRKKFDILRREIKENGYDGESMQKMNYMMRDWFYTQISNDDMQLAEFLREEMQQQKGIRAYLASLLEKLFPSHSESDED